MFLNVMLSRLILFGIRNTPCFPAWASPNMHPAFPFELLPHALSFPVFSVCRKSNHLVPHLHLSELAWGWFLPVLFVVFTRAAGLGGSSGGSISDFSSLFLPPLCIRASRPPHAEGHLHKHSTATLFPSSSLISQFPLLIVCRSLLPLASFEAAL